MRTNSTANQRGGSGKGTSQAPTRAQKVRATFHLPADLFEECWNAVVALSGPPLRLTLAAFAENALRDELERMQKQQNKGKPFPKRAGELRGGRPIKG